jgi:hypothetical protein
MGYRRQPIPCHPAFAVGKMLRMEAMPAQVAIVAQISHRQN